MEGYRSGHNGADSKSDGGRKLSRGFESHLLRQFALYEIISKTSKLNVSTKADVLDAVSVETTNLGVSPNKNAKPHS